MKWASNSVAEYRPFKARVEGSNPSWPTKYSMIVILRKINYA